MEFGVEIREIPMTVSSYAKAVDQLLVDNGLRRDEMSVYYGIFDSSDRLVGGGGLDTRYGIIKCVAISPEFRGTGVANSLISRLRSEARLHGFNRITVSTKPEYEVLFSDLAFHTVGRTKEAVLLESTPRGVKDFVKNLAQHKKQGRNGIIVMNANPFTKGHKYLISNAASQVDNLYVLVVEEDRSIFPFKFRKRMVEDGTEEFKNVFVLSTGPYSISSETFPSYFLKKRDDATDVSIRLDLDIFVRHIAPALGVSVRFAGNEPNDRLTARYNELMGEILPKHGIEFIEIERVVDNKEMPISASGLRENISKGNIAESLETYGSNPALLLAWFAMKALKEELDLTPKPGLVDQKDNGAHTDMNYDLMMRSIEAILPGLINIADSHSEMPDVEAGLKTEKEMFDATGGINTHKGAIFAMGLTLYCANKLISRNEEITSDALSKEISLAASNLKGGVNTHGEKVRRDTGTTSGALEMAQSGYYQLFTSWLPYFRNHRNDEYCKHKLLLKIITELDDTNVLHRAGEEGASWLKIHAKEVFENCSESLLSSLNDECIKRNISPGGAADMFALTLLIDSIINQKSNLI